ncbi:ferritin-like domain-containing protein [Chitinophaga pendula]|uniref:YciE/YciF ferroxidase family protein n=1 Tax=Chitinophaga TaxID=79328 RepID=UPI000BB06DF6|nr:MULTISPECIES: ferritin-like domain-containing protein [Chitinophaga]ASZ12544.1 rubrerythrin family protein [Chitinophaga sp. MD30]UCJ09852.1 ferritin-like domain-containing protein [Chitinophaga pendula]
MQTVTDTSANSKLEVFFITMLQEIYWSEQNLINVLSTMTISATHPELIQAFDLHKRQTEEHVRIVERVFNMLDRVPEALPSAGLQGLFDEGWQVIDETEAGTSQRDVALIIAAQKVEHYEIACYGSLVTIAATLGLTKVVDELRVILTEEKETDATLTIIAESKINVQASEEKV